MNLLMGLDLGTTALKIALYNQKGQLLASATEEYKLLTPKSDYVEVEVSTYWIAFQNGLKQLKKQYSIKADDAISFGISAQGETLILMDEAGNPLMNAIVWMDNRAHEEAESLRNVFGDETCYKTCGQVSFEPCWPACKLLWVKNNKKDVYNRIHKILLIEDYFIYRLTGEWVTEGSLVCSSAYYDIIQKKYWPEMLEYLCIEESQLPVVKESGEFVSKISDQASRSLGLPVATSICTGALDQVAGAIGVGNIKPGMFSENIGAALAICVPVDRPVFDPNRKMPLHYFGIPNTYMLHTFTTGGMALRWYRDKFCREEMKTELLTGKNAYQEISEQVGTVQAGSEGLLMLPHLSGSMAPDVNANARGVWFGFSLKHTKAHFARALMESIGYILKRNIETLEEMAIEVKEIRSLGGGAKSGVWNQIKADIVQKPLATSNIDEAACLGAAILAGKGTGLFTSLDEAIANMIKVDKIFYPNGENKEVYACAYDMYKQIFMNLETCFNEMNVK